LYGTFSFFWYIDESPTFGVYNDDSGGGIRGRTRDRDSALNGATVHIMSVHGRGTMTVRTRADTLHGSGYFQLRPTGPGRFVVTVECPGYLPYTYPDTLELAANQDNWLNIYLERACVAEGRAGLASLVSLRQRGRSLVLATDRPGKALVAVYDNLGRVRISERVRLVSGTNEVALPSLGSGVYFASCGFGDGTLKTKLVLY
jgi:hypothetical protein